MLVSPSGNIQKRTRQHRRQISIPVALEAANAPTLPAAAMKLYSMHKRGSSLDQRAHLIPKDAYTTRHPNVLRETQQQQHMSRLNQPYFDQSHIHMSSNTDCQQLGPGGLNVFTNPSSNENLVNYACMDNGGFDAEIENLKFRQNKPTVANGLDSQTLNEESWKSYAISQSGLPQAYDLRRMSVQSDLSQHSYTPSTPPKQMHTSECI